MIAHRNSKSRPNFPFRLSNSNLDQDLHPISRLWILRVLCMLGGYKKFLSRVGFENDELASHLGLGDWLDNDEEEIQIKQLKLELDKRHVKSEKSAKTLKLPDMMGVNSRMLGGLIGFSDTELRILEFAVMVHTDSLLCAACDYLDSLDRSKLTHALSVILRIPAPDISECLQLRGLLAQSGLLKVDPDRHNMANKLDLMSHSFAGLFRAFELDPPTLLQDAIATAAPAKLTLTNYDYLSSFIQILRPYLQDAIRTGRKGANVLIHGKPGTGKSELARVIAQNLGLTLFEVSSEDRDGDPRDGAKRLEAYRCAQCLFAHQKNTLLMFDEVEDIFSGGFFFRSAADKNKAWINRALENNPVPTIWISNNVDCLDPAFVRRFDLVQEIPIPPKSAREHILQEAAQGMLDAKVIKRLAESEHLSPAVVTRSAAVVNAIKDALIEPPEQVMETLIANTMTAQRLKRIPKEDPARLPEVYDPAFINTDTDMAALAAGIKTSGSARICLYGPPGTGKTAFGRWLAEQLSMPLHVKRASDILSMWVGENEKNIANAFHQAESENAILLIDEVDNFLRDRSSAQRGWEASMVNEMLTQMEAFPGIFIASTNLMDGLDEASLRRFDLKVKFKHLRPEQGWELFRRHCAMLGHMPTEESEVVMRSLGNLAPGDFAAVARQAKFRPLASAVAFAQALARECVLKKGGSNASIGFL